MKQLLIILLLVSCIFAEWGGPSLNTGSRFYDTIPSFNADSFAYTTKAFNYSGYLNLLVDVYVDDSSSVGFSADSTNFYWGVQTGHITKDSIGVEDTVWSKTCYIVDTLSRYDSLYNDTNVVIGLDGLAPDNIRGIIDTANVAGLANQYFNISIPFDGLIRGFVGGLAGNEIGTFLDIKMQFTRKTKDL